MAGHNGRESRDPFIEADRESVANEINTGNTVFRIRSRILLDVEEISGREFAQKWEWQVLYVGEPRYNNLTAQQFEDNHAGDFVIDYYNRQEENGVVTVYPQSLTIWSVERYDNTNVAQLPLAGNSYQVRMLKNIKDVELILQKGECLFEYVCYKMRGLYTRKELYEAFGAKVISIFMIVEWIKKGTPRSKWNKNISLYAWWENRRLAYKFQTNNTSGNTRVLNFMINDLHAIPVENDTLFTPNKLKDLKLLSKNLEDSEKEINWRFDYHFNNYYYVDNNTFDKNKDKILAGEFKPEYEALIFEIRKNNSKPNDNIDIVKNRK